MGEWILVCTGMTEHCVGGPVGPRFAVDNMLKTSGVLEESLDKVVHFMIISY
jgi:hypothetical protein